MISTDAIKPVLGDALAKVEVANVEPIVAMVASIDRVPLSWQSVVFDDAYTDCDMSYKPALQYHPLSHK